MGIYLIKQIKLIKDGEAVTSNVDLSANDIEAARKILKEINRCERVLLVYEEVGTV